MLSPRKHVSDAVLEALGIGLGRVTERLSANWPSEIRNVISKSNELADRVRFEITSMISDQNCATRSSIISSLKCRILVSTNINILVGNKSCKIRHTMAFFVFYFPEI